MSIADVHASEVVDRLRASFPCSGIIASEHSLLVGRGVLIGAEIEVPWRAYFPDLWEQYFGGRRTFKDLSPKEIADLTEACSEREKHLLPRLEATRICGIEQGKERYWEFAFPAVNNLCLMLDMFQVLNKAGLLPWGRHSLHMTISGITAQTAFVILTLTELLYVRKERIKKGFHSSGSWSRKGSGGIYKKRDDCEPLMYGASLAYELRTLELPDVLEDCNQFFWLIARVTRLQETASGQLLLNELSEGTRELLRRFDLPATVAWLSPHEMPKLWTRYLESMDEMRPCAKKLINSVVCA